MNNGDNTAIFSTDIGVIALNGSVKIKILDFLKQAVNHLMKLYSIQEKQNQQSPFILTT